MGLATVYGIVRQHQGWIQLIFTDIVMPGGISGLELAQTLRNCLDRA